MKKQKDEKCIKKDHERERNDTLKRLYIHEIGAVEREEKRNWVEAMLEKIMLFGSSLTSQTDDPQHNLGEAPAQAPILSPRQWFLECPWKSPSLYRFWLQPYCQGSGSGMSQEKPRLVCISTLSPHQSHWVHAVWIGTLLCKDIPLRPEEVTVSPNLQKQT